MSCFGRTAELARLLGLLPQVPVALIVGLPGIGKTELAYRVEAELAATRPLQSTHIACEASMEGRLYACLLESLTGSPQEDSLDSLVDLLAKEPRLLVLDDAHVVAAQAAALIDRLMRRISVEGRLVVTARSMLPVKTAPALVRLEPLSAEESEELIQHLAARQGVRLDDPAALAARGLGIPQLLRDLVAGYGPDERVLAALRESLNELDAPARSALMQLAAVTKCSRARSAAEHLSLPESILQTLDQRCFIKREPERLIVHEIVREAVLHSADADEVHASRRRTADALWQQYVTSRDATVALEAVCLYALAGDSELAMQHLQDASRTLTDAGFDQAVLPMLEPQGKLDAIVLSARIFLRAGRLRDAERKLAMLDSAARADVRVVVLKATLTERQGDLESARRGYEEALAAATSSSVRYWLQLRIAIVSAMAGRTPEASLLLDRIESELRGTPSAARTIPRYWWARAVTKIANCDWHAALNALREGLRTAEEVGDRELLFLFRVVRLLVTYELGHLEQARVWAAEPAATGQPHTYATELLRGATALAGGELDLAIKHLRSAQEHHDRERDLLLAALAARYLSQALLARGSILASSEVLRSTASAAAHHGHVVLAAATKVALANTLVVTGRLGEAQALAGELMASPVPTIQGEAHALLAKVAAFRGDLLESRQHLARALTAVEELPTMRAKLMLDQATLELFGGDPERARAEALAVADSDAYHHNPPFRGRVLYVLAAADLAAGLVDAALEALAEAELIAKTYALGQLAEDLKLLRGSTSLGESICNRIPTEHRPGFLGLLRVLGLSAGTLVVSSRHGRVHTDVDHLSTVARHFDIVIDRVANSLRGPTRTAEGRAMAVSILAGLAESDGEVSPERLYQIVWGGNEYHPLRHRNTLYIALNRTRKLLKEMGESREVILRGATGWTISPEVALAIVRRDPRVSTVAAAL